MCGIQEARSSCRITFKSQNHLYYIIKAHIYKVLLRNANNFTTGVFRKIALGGKTEKAAFKKKFVDHITAQGDFTEIIFCSQRRAITMTHPIPAKLSYGGRHIEIESVSFPIVIFSYFLLFSLLRAKVHKRYRLNYEINFIVQ